MLSSLWPWSFWPLILLYCFIVSATTLSFFLLLITVWPYELIFLPYQPISSLIPCLGLPSPTFHVFTSFELVSQHSCHIAHFTTLFLGLPWLIYFFFTSFYSHGLVAKFLGLPWPFYYIFTSYYSLGLIDHCSCHATPLILLIYSLRFPGLFTSSLPLIIPMDLLFHYLGFLSPFISSLPLAIFMGLLTINPATSAQWACFLISLLFFLSFSFIFLIVGSFCFWALCQKWASKVI